jgi:hypothetical protein
LPFRQAEAASFLAEKPVGFIYGVGGGAAKRGGGVSA